MSLPTSTCQYLIIKDSYNNKAVFFYKESRRYIILP